MSVITNLNSWIFDYLLNNALYANIFSIMLDVTVINTGTQGCVNS